MKIADLDHCHGCGLPTHASESTDDGMCRACSGIPEPCVCCHSYERVAGIDLCAECDHAIVAHGCTMLDAYAHSCDCEVVA